MHGQRIFNATFDTDTFHEKISYFYYESIQLKKNQTEARFKKTKISDRPRNQPKLKEVYVC